MAKEGFIQPRSKRHRVVKRIKKIINLFSSKSSQSTTASEKQLSEAKGAHTVPSQDGANATSGPKVLVKKRTAPPHLTLLGLPRELRDLIFHHVFEGNGSSYVTQQLLGFPKQDYSTYSNGFRILLTSRQIYAEAFPYAYRLSCFYWFKSYTTATLEKLCHRLSPTQAKNVRHIAFWSNPYLYEEFLDNLPPELNLTSVTVCSNYMSGHIPPTTIHGRMSWLLKNIKKLRTLKRFYFLTGCGIDPGNKTSDCDFSLHLRRAFEAKEFWGSEAKGVEVGPFDPETWVTKITVLPQDGSDDDGEKEQRRRVVELKIASVYEQGFNNR